MSSVVGECICEFIPIGVFVYCNIVGCWSSNLDVILWYLHILEGCCKSVYLIRWANIMILSLCIKNVYGKGFGTWLFIELGGNFWFFVYNSICTKMDNDMCVFKWAGIWGEVLVLINVWYNKYN